MKKASRRLQPRVDPLFPVKDIWLPYVPPNGVLYLGSHLGKSSYFLTSDMLQKKG